MEPGFSWQLAIVVWFAVSVVTHLLSGVVLAIWVSRHGVKIQFFVSGMPGYVEKRYRDWAVKEGRSSNLILNLSIISSLNAIIASIFFIGMLTLQAGDK
jgi:hypothetical protein